MRYSVLCIRKLMDHRKGPFLYADSRIQPVPFDLGYAHKALLLMSTNCTTQGTNKYSCNWCENATKLCDFIKGETTDSGLHGTPLDSAGLQDRMESRSPIYSKY